MTVCTREMDEMDNETYLFFPQEKEFRYLLKERVCPLITELLAPTLVPHGKKMQLNPTGEIGQSGSGSSDGAGPSEFALNVRLNRLIWLLCSRFFDCLVRSSCVHL